MTRALYTYPWNLHDLDADAAAIRALGIDEISLAASYHAGKFIQPHDARRRVYFPEDGTVYFRPRRQYHAIKPQVAAITGQRDTLQELCGRGTVKMNAWVVLNHNTRLGMLHPGLVVHNCHGDPYPYSLCPAHPEVREYAVTLAADLAAHYDLARLLLETPGYLGYAHGFHHEFAQLAVDATLDALLGLCFCEACLAGAARADIDASDLRKRTAERVDALLGSEVEDDERSAWDRLERDLQNDAELAAYHAWRAETVTSLVAEIRAAVRPEVAVKVISTTQRSHRLAYLEGHDLAALAQVCDGLEAPLYQSSTRAFEEELRFLRGQLGAAPMSAILRPGFPDMDEEAQLRERFASLQAAGLGDIAFYNYGLLKPNNLAWIRRLLTTDNIP